ncbi:GNAT family N-acetyltransferase [Marinomonas sp. IMCC 4694]|uniref:GNAT family N-acetyltransferase n=1 Tax=Marinomonas sp. IMCC 4694 TaxID=2605432 RepID=UPI0011E614F1|nr:GNAT family N-acetyltransferase [Marinomonas sp. IMCC 4694]TYL48264.1 GNAT family N-acetyltransferase [Marinomonas sp. IMCC 4694]
MPNKPFLIRNAVLDDAPALLDIFRQCEPLVNNSDSRHGTGLIDVMDWLDNASEQHPMLVVEHQKKAIAWCSLEPFYGLPAFDLACEISLYVRPDWQRKGIGRRLFQYLEAQRAVLKFTHLVAYIYASNLNSRAFFKRQGFEEWGLLPNIAQNQDTQDDVFLFGIQYLPLS